MKGTWYTLSAGSSRILFVLTWLIGLATVHAEDSPKEARDSYIFQLCEQSVRNAATVQLNALIDDMQLALNLPPDQLRKLRFAAKGAVVNFAKQQIKQDNRIIDDLCRSIHPDAEHFVMDSKLIDLSRFRATRPESTEEDHVDRESNRPEQDKRLDLAMVYPKVSFRFKQKLSSWLIRGTNGSTSHGVKGGFERLMQAEPWKRTLQRSVTESDRQRYQAFKDRRATEAITEMLSGYLELQLRLNKHQKSQVEVWLAPQVKINDDVHLPDHSGLFKRSIRSLNPQGLDQILDANQLALWRNIRDAI